MANNRLPNRLHLVRGRAIFAQEVHGLDGAVVFKGHVCGGEVGWGGAEVVEEAGEVEFFAEGVEVGEVG
ncbi:hypothetical protein IAQ61_003642 [Plenodomus lingam]|uniref:uncharacterized protein n=1 Tax=Leptosphaeria maculans TaxID=5022 RepID=UPI00332EAA29|nr:hypothetical protein IAQ61_003642 [Plenodomus lingam]